jgi:hypothetical protein
MITLKLFGNGSSLCISNYTIVPELLFDVVAQTSDEELSSFEKLFVVKSINQKIHPGYLADVYMRCGCFAEARSHCSDPQHPRKLGDIYWCEGKLDEAQECYLKATSPEQPYRRGPDIDRLIKLAFFRERWSEVISWFSKGVFCPGTSRKRVILGQNETSATPYLDMLLVATCRQQAALPQKATEILESAFRMNPCEWAQFLGTQKIDDKLVGKLKSRCRPRLGSQQRISLAAAIKEGDSARACHVVDYIRSADLSLEAAQLEIADFGETGNTTSLDQFIHRVTGSGIKSLSHTFLFAALGHDSFLDAGIPPDRLIRLFGAHSIMNKRHFGKLLDLRFKHHVPLTSDDILVGIFQLLYRSTPFENTKNSKPLGSVRELSSCQEWARVRLDDWLSQSGTNQINKVARIWREGQAQPISDSLWPTTTVVPATPRNTVEWHTLMDKALTWLRNRWECEIATTPWVSENQLLQILQYKLKPRKVVQHARPTWLEPQHLDIYLPELGIAVEYMGRQHFEPLDYFGGQLAFEAVIKRDKKKAELCKANGIELIRVRFDEDIGHRALEIANNVQTRFPSKI